MATLTRTTRSSMLDVLKQEYLRTARAKGIPEKIVITSHALRNALIPIITIIGTQLAGVLGGSVLTETVFAWPGVGRLIVDSLNMRDTPLVTGSIIMTTILLSIILLLVDLLYAVVDPRIKAQYVAKRGKKETWLKPLKQMLPEKHAARWERYGISLEEIKALWSVLPLY